MIKGFPKAYAIGSSNIPDLLKGDVEVTEKIDGSQFAFGVIDGTLKIRSKNKEIHIDSVNNMFYLGVSKVIELYEGNKIPENHVFICEYLKNPRHNVLAYEKTPFNNLALFAVYDVIENIFFHYDSIAQFAKYLNIDIVPLLFKGHLDKPTLLKDMLDNESYLGGQKIEGVVVKNYANMQIGKYVSESFKEVSRKKKNFDKEKDKIALLKEMYRTEARWQKAYQHLRDSGDLQGNAKDIGNIIKEVVSDLKSEEENNIKQYLYDALSPDIFKRAVSGLPEWYKGKLMENINV